MSKTELRKQHPDIAKFVDDIREHMSIDSMVFPYKPEVFSIRESRMSPPFIGNPNDKR